VKKNRVGNKKAMPWDIEQFSFNYAFSETFKRNQTIQYSVLQNYTGSILYNYTFVNKPVQPFGKIESPHLQLLKDFNFNYLPAAWSVRFEGMRRYGETLNRTNDSFSLGLPVFYDKLFTMRRYYEFKYDITKSLKLDYTATADTRIDEPLGDVSSQEKKDSISRNFWKGGRLTAFNQMTRLNYNIPINKLPYMAFVNQASYNYTANFQWAQAPPAADSLGSTISNSKQQQWNLGLNMTTFYNQFNIFKRLNATGKPATPQEPGKKKKKANPKDKKDAEKTPATGKLPLWASVPLKLISSLKNASGSYTVNEGTTLPGFKPKPQYLGQNFDVQAPGWDFIFGLQDRDYRFKAARNGWVSNDPNIVNPYLETYMEKISGTASLEPFDDFRVTLSVDKSYSKSLTSYFKFDPDSAGGIYHDFGIPIEQGSYSITYSTWRTSFAGETNNVSEVFKQFENNRIIIANRLASDPTRQHIEGRDSAGFPLGYSRYQQEVLVPAFLAAYSGTDANGISLSPFPQIPIPNWRVQYSGLTKIGHLKDYFSSINIQNNYSSVYSVTGFQTVLDTARNTVQSQDFQPKYLIRSISIVERWGPLIGVDVTLINNVTTGFKYSMDRSLNLALGNRQLTEVKGQELTFRIGYKTNKLTLPFKGPGGRRYVLNNDINFVLDFSIRDNVTKIRNLDIQADNNVNGQAIYTFKPSVNYMFNEKLMMQIFYSRTQTNPYTSNSFPTIITSGGFSLRYTIQ
jgi:cell surface protein SprA